MTSILDRVTRHADHAAQEATVTQRTHPVALSDDEFRNVIGHFASGVTVITTAVGDRLYGSTASAFSSLSLEPFSVLAALNATSTTNPAIAASGFFAVNILAEDQADVAKHFARRSDDKFAGVDHHRSEFGGVPVLDRAHATIVCEVMDTPVGGTHTVFFGRVLEAAVGGGTPLAYYRGKFGKFTGFDEA